MGKIPKEILRAYLKEGNFSTAKELRDSLRDLMRDMLQEALEAELSDELGYEKHEKGVISDNSRNSYSKKKVKSSYGEIDLDIPRDKNGEFEPKIVPKYSRDISNLEEKVISM